MRLVPIECVRDNCFLGKTIYDKFKRPLLKKGVKLTNKLIGKIKERKINTIFIIDEYSDKEIDNIIKPELKQKSINIIKETFTNIKKIYLDLHNKNLNKQQKNKLIKEKEDYFLSINKLAEELIDDIISNKNILVNLVDIKTMDQYTYQHSVNVAIISLVLGIGLKLNKSELKNLCVGALLHDIGKIFIPKKILLKKGPLTNLEFDLMKKHPKKGYDYIKDISYINQDAKLIALQHQERIDGLGYPAGLKGNEISNLSKITSIADVYDALTSDRPYRKALCPNDAFEYIISQGDKLFDFNIVKAFSEIIVPYPQGTIVMLSNGDIAVVEETPISFPLRPNIKIIKSRNKSLIGKRIKLINKLSLVISSIEYSI